MFGYFGYLESLDTFHAIGTVCVLWCIAMLISSSQIFLFSYHSPITMTWPSWLLNSLFDVWLPYLGNISHKLASKYYGIHVLLLGWTLNNWTELQSNKYSRASFELFENRQKRGISTIDSKCIIRKRAFPLLIANVLCIVLVLYPMIVINIIAITVLCIQQYWWLWCKAWLSASPNDCTPK